MRLSAVVDCFDGRSVAWPVGPRPMAEPANPSLRAAYATLGDAELPTVHFDCGGHYCWSGWVGMCEANGLVRSMLHRG